MIDKLKEMLGMQQALDEAIFAEHGGSYEEVLKKRGYFWAILDEIGEWNHEQKPSWCWWKKDKKPINRQKELEELVDILHFAMSHDLALCKGDPEEALREIQVDLEMADLVTDPVQVIRTMIIWADDIDYEDPATLTSDFIELLFFLPYSFDEIYEAYMAKNKINFERLANDY